MVFTSPAPCPHLLIIIMRIDTADCNEVNTVKPREPVRCRACGYRILFKLRVPGKSALCMFPTTLISFSF